MLKSTFCHIRGIGVGIERLLWEAGILSWSDLMACSRLPVGLKTAESLRRGIEESIRRFDTGDTNYFARRLPASEHWRLFPSFRDSTAYLDIETTGLAPTTAHITTIALYDGRRLKCFVHDDNIHEFPADMSGFRLLITYNGKTFDVPFLRHYFDIDFPQIHIDLRYLLASIGFRGGLKNCERELGIVRASGMEDLDGRFAVLLWHEYADRGDPLALETLLAYNVADTVNLETLMIIAYNMKLADTPFAESHAILQPQQPPNPYSPHNPTINRIRSRYFGPF